ncbi:hypothetical protein ACMYYO_09505 [Dermacoccaceae bacterium W4C1]
MKVRGKARTTGAPAALALGVSGCGGSEDARTGGTYDGYGDSAPDPIAPTVASGSSLSSQAVSTCAPRPQGTKQVPTPLGWDTGAEVTVDGARYELQGDSDVPTVEEKWTTSTMGITRLSGPEAAQPLALRFGFLSETGELCLDAKRAELRREQSVGFVVQTAIPEDSDPNTLTLVVLGPTGSDILAAWKTGGTTPPPSPPPPPDITPTSKLQRAN